LVYPPRAGPGGGSDRRTVAYVTKLIAEHDFPHPLPALRKGGELTSDVTINSTCRARPWKADRKLGPRRRRRDRQDAQAAAAAEIDANAGNLGRLHLIRGGRA
jgi:hypothetical protein